MIYQRQFLKETTYTAMGIFVVILAVLVFTQGITMLGRAADGRIAIDSVVAMVGFWVLGMTPLILVLSAYISVITVLTRFWRDSEMSIWLSSGLGLWRWIKPVLTFALPLAILVAVMQFFVLPWAELRSREYSEILKQQQSLSLVEQGTFAEIGKANQRIYFVEQFDSKNGTMANLFVREYDAEKGRDTVVFAKKGHIENKDNRRTLILETGYRYNGLAGQGDFDQVQFDRLELIVDTTPKIVNPIDHRSTIPSAKLLGSRNPMYQAELMWRISLPITLLLLSVLAIPISYFNPRSGTSYHVFVAVGFFLLYQNGLTMLRNAVSNSKIDFWLGLLPMHILIAMCIFVLIRMRSMPAKPFWRGLKQAVFNTKK